MTRCSYCEAEVPADTAMCPNCGANLGPTTPTRFGSPMADGWIGGLGSFFGSIAVLVLGAFLSQYSPWLLLVSFLLAIGGAATALTLSWKKYPTLRLGMLIGFGLAILNPLTLCAGFFGIITLFG